MVYVPATAELFVTTHNGHVMKWGMDRSNFSRDCATLFQSDGRPVRVEQFMDFALIVADRVFLVNGERLLSIDLGHPLAVTGSPDNRLFVFDRSGEVSEYTILDVERDLTPATYKSASTPRRLIRTDHGTGVVSRRSVPDGFQSSFDILKRDGHVDSMKFDSDLGLVSALFVPEDSLLLGFMRGSDAGVLEIRRLGDASGLVQSVELPGVPYAMARDDGIVVVGVGKRLHVLKNDGGRWVLQPDPSASLHSQIAFVEIQSGYVWVGDRTQSVICFKYAVDDRKLQLFPVAVDIQPRQLTAMCCYDDVTVAAGDRYGNIV
jgi:hypothetical protein